MKEKEIYLAGGCYWGVEKYVSLEEIRWAADIDPQHMD